MFLITDVLAMIRDIRSANRTVDMWGAALNVPQILGGLVFILSIEGQLVLVTVIVTLLSAAQIHKRSPFSRLTGLCHLPWLALAPWLVYRLQSAEHNTGFQIWGYYVLITMVVSLLFDAFDLYRYFNGAKTYAWRA
jgi:hypothetical protein